MLRACFPLNGFENMQKQKSSLLNRNSVQYSSYYLHYSIYDNFSSVYLLEKPSTTYSTAQLSGAVRNSALRLRYSKKRQGMQKRTSQLNLSTLSSCDPHWIIIQINYNVWVATIVETLLKWFSKLYYQLFVATINLILTIESQMKNWQDRILLN
ncbi:Hypothetical_protein [Hexamita inflata]|uniref:Hypothetical_protein n=1 Tax=Hexamita inflata TaxID=28002 RepID=A0AA86Q650_9EUKA|nr:Hypothetical protein HINF_LOCUS40771 [Hexamita inflata]CAI9953129.1 Hypothetical protein HINF_LOCUS40774 [Hexamita inflata]